MSATPVAGGVPPIFVDRRGQPMRFFVDAGGDIDSNTRRTSIRKIQRRGGEIVFSPSEAQYIIVWDDTSDGQLYARTWSNERKIVLTLEWINLCVRGEKFIGPSERYGGCAVGITDGAIQPLAKEGAFDEEEESAPAPVRNGKHLKPLTSSSQVASEFVPSTPAGSMTALRIPPAPTAFHTPNLSATAPSSDAVRMRTTKAIPQATSTSVLVEYPESMVESNTVQAAQDFELVINQLHSQPSASAFNPPPIGSSSDQNLSADLGTFGASQPSTSIPANLLLNLPQHVLDMLARTLQPPLSNAASPHTVPAIPWSSSPPVPQLSTQPELSHTPVPARLDEASYHPSSTAIHAATMASNPLGAGTESLSVSHMEVLRPPQIANQAENDANAMNDALARHAGTALLDSRRNTPKISHKRKRDGKSPSVDAYGNSIKRARVSKEAPDLSVPLPPLGQPQVEYSAQSMPSSSQGSGLSRFFTLNEGGREVQTAFWVQPEIKERTKLIRAINRHGGRIAHSMSDCHYVVVRSSLSDTGKNKSAEMGWKHGRTVVKPAWIEACVAAHDLIPIDSYVMVPPITPKKKGRAGTSSATPKKVKPERADSSTTLADPITPSRSHVHEANFLTGHAPHNGWEAKPIVPGDSDDE